MLLHQLVHLLVGEVLPLEDKRLTYLIQRCIVEILGLERFLINDLEAWVASLDDMLFDDLQSL